MASKSHQLSPQVFATTQLHLLTQEQASEVAENQLLLSSSPAKLLARSGLAILNLTVVSLHTGLGGRTVLELSLDPAVARLMPDGKAATDLPEHGVRTGDIVRVSELAKGGAKKKDVEALKTRGLEGVVTRVGERAVWVAVGKDGSSGDEAEVPDGKLWLVKLANDVTYKRMNTTITKFLKLPDSSYTPLTRVLFGLSFPGTPDISSVSSIQFTDPTLNSSQQDAIRFALASPEIALIHGPPGTGKTHTLIELIVQLLIQNPAAKILVCGPSNISVDNIVERLASLPNSHPTHAKYKKPTFLRLGHPARLLPSVLSHSLEVLTQTSEAAQLVTDIRAEIDVAQSSIRKTRNARERRGIYGEIKELRKEYRVREGKCIDDLIRGSQVVLATLHGAGGYQIRNTRFDIVVVDEASQALEAQCWIPLLMTGGEVRKLILAGDHLQLPPTIKSTNEKKDKTNIKKDLQVLETQLTALALTDNEKKAAKSMTLETTMFDRLLTLHGPEIKRLLTTQYRMHENIMRFPSDELYDSKLIAADAVKARLLKDLSYHVEDTEDTREPLVFFDTQGGNFPERIEDENSASEKRSLLLADSKSNPAEAALVAHHVSNLLNAGVREEDVAVITPYNAQLGAMSGLLKERWPGIELGSVDGFQGREKECVIVSLVRSNREGEVGFLGDKRRLNVAMTRPKRHLCVIGDSETVSRGSSFLKRWMKFLEENADLRYPNIDDLELG